jgi:amylosucrase
MSAPAFVHDAAAAALAGLPPYRRRIFLRRLDRWWEDLHAGLTSVYSDADAVAQRVVAQAAFAFAERDPDLGELDEQRVLAPDWFQAPRMLGYATYADRFAGTLTGVHEHIAYLRELGVTYLHLMPLLTPRDGDNDGGYAVADYRSVRPDLGTVADLRALSATLRTQGISLVLDLVINHVAREHDWAVAARNGDPHYRAYFHTYTDRAMPDAYERTLPEVFPDFAPGSFTWDDDLKCWVWTTFNSWQWDVNWTNPDVFCEYADIIFFLANAGVEVVRLDAIAFLWKRLGTDSQNQPEVHAITQALRALARIACPALVFKAEAIVAPTDLVRYFGTGAYHGKVSDLAYHNSLMVQIWSMLAAGDVRLAAQALRALPPTPSTTAWIAYVRCHDDIGWAISDEDADAVGLQGWAHRAFLSDYYAGLYPGSTSRGLVFQFNPETGDRRISGMAASLVGVEAADDEDEIVTAVSRLLLAYAIVFGWGAIPVIWMGDELALPNDLDWAVEAGHEDDNRWAHRPRMNWAAAQQRCDPDSVAGQVFGAIADMAAVRAELPHLHASIASEVIELSNRAVLPVLRRHPVGNFLALYNVTPQWQPFPAYRLDGLGLTEARDALSDEPPNRGDDGNLWLAPYQAVWLVN